MFSFKGFVDSIKTVAAAVPGAVGLSQLAPGKQTHQSREQTKLEETAITGSEIVQRYETKWKAIYQNGENLATSASALDQSFEKSKHRCATEYRCFQQLNEELKSLPTFIGEIVSLRSDIEEIGMRLESLDSGLQDLIEFRADCDYQNWKRGTEHSVVKQREVQRKKELADLERSLQIKQRHLINQREEQRRQQQRLQEKPVVPSLQSLLSSSASAPVSAPAATPAIASSEPISDENELELDSDLMDALESLDSTVSPSIAEPPPETT